MALIALMEAPPLIACQCQKSTNKFTSHLSSYGFVGLVEIIAFDTINDHDFDHTFTIVKVIKQYNDSKTTEIISVVNGDGGSCYSSLPGNTLGSRFIIKASFDSRSEYEADMSDFVGGTQNDGLKERVLVLSLCDEHALIIQGDSIKGNITKRSKLKKASLDEGKQIVQMGNSRKLKEFGYYLKQQQMNVARVEQIINRRLNG